MTYTQIRAGLAIDGDIVKIVDQVYDPSIISDKWHTHFVTRTRYMRIVKVSNNGTALLRNIEGKHKGASLFTDKNIIAVYRKVGQERRTINAVS